MTEQEIRDTYDVVAVWRNRRTGKSTAICRTVNGGLFQYHVDYAGWYAAGATSDFGSLAARHFRDLDSKGDVEWTSGDILETQKLITQYTTGGGRIARNIADNPRQCGDCGRPLERDQVGTCGMHAAKSQ